MAGRGVNKVILIGNLGADPEVRYMPNGSAVCNFNVATSESWKDKQTGEQRTQTEWHRVTMYRRLAEIAGEYLKKGSKIYLEGRLQTRKWQGQDGQDHYTTEIIANDMQMLDSRSGGTANFDDNAGSSFGQPAPSAPSSASDPRLLPASPSCFGSYPNRRNAHSTGIRNPFPQGSSRS